MFIAHPDKSDRTYVPSLGFDGDVLTERHPHVHKQVSGIDGWLEPEDSLKLYELGYLARGPFLEIGTYHGKSTAVLTTAIRDAGRTVEFYSLDIAHESLDSARATLAGRGLGPYVKLVHGSVTALFRAFPMFRPRLVFLDGDHSAAGVRRDLAALETRVPEGGLLLFHDFLDDRNDDPSNDDYGVTEAIRDSWVARDCEFAGTFGCTGLYRRERCPPGTAADADAPALVELIRLDRLAVRLLIGVLRPAKRALGRSPRASGR
jgi:hypothetical protein